MALDYFSILMRGMKGIYQHCREKHLHRYLAEFDFRYNHRIKLGFNDAERAALALRGAEGKRRNLTEPVSWFHVQRLLRELRKRPKRKP